MKYNLLQELIEVPSGPEKHMLSTGHAKDFYLQASEYILRATMEGFRVSCDYSLDPNCGQSGKCLITKYQVQYAPVMVLNINMANSVLSPKLLRILFVRGNFYMNLLISFKFFPHASTWYQLAMPFASSHLELSLASPHQVSSQ
jgi:hypothetical protein